MTRYRYRALGPDGDRLEGDMDAGSSEEVIAWLRSHGNLPISAEVASGGGFALRGLPGTGRRGVSRAEVTMLTGELATLLGAGLTLDRSLHVLIELGGSAPVTELLSGIRRRIRGGESLATALGAEPAVFPRLYVNMVRAGELGGTLASTLRRLADYLERTQALRESVRSALVYPLLLLVMAGVSLMVLMVYVVPQFTVMFEDLGAELPLSTRVVIAAGGILRHGWWLILAVLALGVWGGSRLLARPDVRQRVDRALLGAPLVGSLLGRADSARLLRTLGTLLESGVPLLEALQLARGVLVNSRLADGVANAARAVRDGATLARALGAEAVFPPLAVHMVQVGEESGNLPAMLLQAADIFDRETRTAIERALSLLVPVLILALAVVIGGIVMSVLLAIISANDLVL